MATKQTKDTTPKTKVKTTPEVEPKTVSTTKKSKKTASFFRSGEGRMYVRSTFNTTRVTFTDTQGNVVLWSTAGSCGFKGSKRSTPFAATTIIEEGMRRAKENGLTSVEVFLKGPGTGRESAMRTIHNAGIEVTEIVDVTPLPHNGCRPPKRRRV